MSSLKPFVLDQSDLDFILTQLNFHPLFDATGNAIINWDGIGTVYNSSNAQTRIAYADLGSAAANIAAYGTSYETLVDLAGLRDVSGLNNNLSHINATYGSVDQIFTRTAAADYAGYSPIMRAVADYAYAAAKTYYQTYGGTDPNGVAATDSFNASGTLGTSYAVTAGGSQHAADGTAITLGNVVDYTPRMISLTVTTAGVVYDTWANHANDPGAASHRPNEIYYDSNGVASVLDWGLLKTVAEGGIGQVDTQARLAASAGNNDHFIGSLNPGVAPSNGFTVLFGQFFDHGLDFIDKGSGKTIKIALAADDPLYGQIGADGQPVHEITITRATVQSFDANGPEYVNHTSPFIDQSQTYGSHDQVTSLLREWVPDTATADPNDYRPGMRLFDGHTLANSWTRPDGTVTNQTLPTLDELRAHVDATSRDALTWDDVLNLRNRDAKGHVIADGQPGAGQSGSALLLDMNPRFDEAHLLRGTSETAAQATGVTTAVNFLNTFAMRPGDTFGFNGAGVLTLHLGSSLSTGQGPAIPAGTDLTGASALSPWVNFADFSIMQTPPGVPTSAVPAIRSAVSDILLASVGDHYVAGDGRVNENFGLTSIHHVFHEEHNYQIDNIIDALHRQDIVAGDPTHAVLHGFQTDTGHGMNAAGDYLDATGAIAWDQDKLFNGAKLVVEMEYQHAAVDQYARNISPNIQEFGAYATSVNSAISLEYAQSAFRFGHSTLRETIDTIDPTKGLTGKIMGYALEQAFLSPEQFGTVGPAAIILGMSHQQMNEVDEFVTPALNQGLLGQPLDLAAINIARGRDIGLPTLNDLRHAVGLNQYTSWNDFGQNLQHPESLAPLIAAYAFDGDVHRAETLVGIADGTVAAGTLGITLEQASGFLNGDVQAGGTGTLGFNAIDSWVGGLAEIHQPGGLLGETFDKIFVDQIENLMDGDRFYYLYRLFGTQFGNEVQNGQLKDIVERSTGLEHLNGNIFGYADKYYDLGAHKEVAATPGAELSTTSNEHKYGDVYDTAGHKVADGALTLHPGLGVYSNGGHGSLNDGHVVTINGVQYIQDTRLPDANPLNGGVNLDGTPNSGAESNEVIIATQYNDLIYAQGGDDTVYGEGGNDIIYGGFGIDRLYGGSGSDTIYGGDNPDLIDGGSGDDFLYGESSGTDINGQDQVIGGAGNDYVSGGIGIDKLFGGTGDDIIYGGQDTDPMTHGDDGNDFIDGGPGTDVLYGDNGDDVIRDGTDVDISFGGDGDDIFQVGDIAQALGAGPDEVIGGDGATDTGFDMMDFSLQAQRVTGVSYDLDQQSNPLTSINGQQTVPAAFQLEGLVGSSSNDTLGGDAGDNWLVGGAGKDTLAGDAGNDIIVGGSIRLDALIGRYNSGYDHNNNNDGSTTELQLQDARYDGASHRVLYSEQIDHTGLIDAANAADPTGVQFGKHFTEMLRTAYFKDWMLGDGGVDATTAANGDTAVYTGKFADYKITSFTYSPGGGAADLLAYRITDQRTATGGTPLVNEGSDILVGVEALQFADRKVSLINAPPTLDLHAFDTTTSTYADNFDTAAWTNSTGTAAWSTSWSETGDVVPGTNAQITSGQIQLDTGDNASHTGGTNQLRLFDNGDGASIQRAVDLTGAASATLSFNYQLTSFDAVDKVVASVSFNGGTTWHEARTIVGTNTAGPNANNNGGQSSVNIDLASLKSAGETFGANTVVKFEAITSLANQATGLANGLSLNNGYVAIDNLSISATKPVADADPFPNNTSTFTEKGGGANIAVNPLITDDGTTLFSAKVVLTNLQAGDVLNKNDIGGDNIQVSVGPSAAGQITLNLTGEDTLAHYQAQLAAITFSNTSNNPSAIDRTIQVTVNDGLANSNLATATVHVVPVNDAPVAGADRIVTNVGNVTNGIVVPDWALLANDSDVDGPNPLTITTLSRLSGLTATHAGGNVTITDTNPANGSFSYTVTDGLATSPNANTPIVTLTEQTGPTLNGSNNAEILIDSGTAHTISGGQGDDIVLAGGGDDTITWNANASGATDGRDLIDGGTGADTVIVAGNSSTETFSIYSNTDHWDSNTASVSSAVHAGFTGLNANTEIVIARNGAVVAELDNVEEIRINTLDTTADNNNNTNAPDGGTSQGDTIQVVGNFTATSLKYSTITVNGGGGNDSVDISGLTSAHRIVFATGGGHDTVVGTLRPQDVVEQTLGASTTPAATAADSAGATSNSGSTSSTDQAGASAPPAQQPNGQTSAGGAGTGAGGVAMDAAGTEGGGHGGSHDPSHAHDPRGDAARGDSDRRTHGRDQERDDDHYHREAHARRDHGDHESRNAEGSDKTGAAAHAGADGERRSTDGAGGPSQSGSLPSEPASGTVDHADRNASSGPTSDRDHDGSDRSAGSHHSTSGVPDSDTDHTRASGGMGSSSEHAITGSGTSASSDHVSTSSGGTSASSDHASASGGTTASSDHASTGSGTSASSDHASASGGTTASPDHASTGNGTSPSSDHASTGNGTCASSVHASTGNGTSASSVHASTGSGTSPSSDHASTGSGTSASPDHASASGGSTASSDHAGTGSGMSASSDHAGTGSGTSASSEHAGTGSGTSASSDHASTGNGTSASSVHASTGSGTSASSDHASASGGSTASSEHASTGSGTSASSDHASTSGGTSSSSNHASASGGTSSSPEHASTGSGTSASPDHASTSNGTSAGSEHASGTGGSADQRAVAGGSATDTGGTAAHDPVDGHPSTQAATDPAVSPSSGIGSGLTSGGGHTPPSQTESVPDADHFAWKIGNPWDWAANNPEQLAIPHSNHRIGDFDAAYYLSTNPDVAAAAGHSVDADSFAFYHFLTFGAAEGRDPNAYFSTRGYLAANADVAAAGMNPLQHYEQFGWHEGRGGGGNFDVHAYLKVNPDVALAQIDPIQHYMHFGAAEGRSLL